MADSRQSGNIKIPLATLRYLSLQGIHRNNAITVKDYSVATSEVGVLLCRKCRLLKGSFKIVLKATIVLAGICLVEEKTN